MSIAGSQSADTDGSRMGVLLQHSSFPSACQAAGANQSTGPHWHGGDTHEGSYCPVQGVSSPPYSSPVPAHIYCTVADHS